MPESLHQRRKRADGVEKPFPRLVRGKEHLPDGLKQTTQSSLSVQARVKVMPNH